MREGVITQVLRCCYRSDGARYERMVCVCFVFCVCRNVVERYNIYSVTLQCAYHIVDWGPLLLYCNRDFFLLLLLFLLRLGSC